MMKRAAWLLILAASLGWSSLGSAQRVQPGSNARPPSATRADPDAVRIVTQAERALRAPVAQVPEAQLQVFRTQATQTYLNSNAFSFASNRLHYSLERQPAGGFLLLSGADITLSPETDTAVANGRLVLTLRLPQAAEGLHLFECHIRNVAQANWTLFVLGAQASASDTVTPQNGIVFFVVDIDAPGSLGTNRVAVTATGSGSMSFDRCEVSKINQ